MIECCECKYWDAGMYWCNLKDDPRLANEMCVRGEKTSYRQSINDLLDRQEAKGISKYGKPLDQNGRDILTAIEYLQEELADGLYYCEELKDKLMAGHKPMEMEG